jgi:hypothetical protein
MSGTASKMMVWITSKISNQTETEQVCLGDKFIELRHTCFILKKA